MKYILAHLLFSCLMAVQASEVINVGSTEELFAARDRLRAAKPTAPVEVRLAPGTYFLDRPFALTASDSGTAAAPIAYVGEKGGTVLSAALRVDSARFRPWKDGIVVADISDLDVRLPTRRQIETVANMPAPVPELFVDGERFSTADWPNAGEWSTFTNFVETGVGWDEKSPTNRFGKAWSAGVFGYDGDRPARWVKAPYLWVHGYFKWDWRDNLLWMKEVDPAARTISLGARATYGLGPGNPSPRRWRAIHLLEELDVPGEYYVDFFGKRLYLMPRRPLTPETRVEIVAGADTLVTLTDVCNVTLRNLSLVGANQALSGTGCSKTVLEGLSVTKIRGNAVTLEDCTETSVSTCDIKEIGGRCLRLAGGDRRTLRSAGNRVVDCDLGPAGLVSRTGAAGFDTTGVGLVFRNNLVHDMPHHGIGIGWAGANDCVFACNIISNCCNESDDASAFYKGRNPSACGNVIEGNVFVDCGRNGKHGTCAIYFDDGDCGDIVRGNVFERCGNPPRHPGASVWGAVFFNGGYAFTCEDNVFIDCHAGATTSAPEGWCTDAWWKGELDGRLGARIAEVNATGEVYTVRYPFLRTIYPPLPVTARTNFLSRCTFINVPAPVNGRTHCLPDCRVLAVDDGTRPAAARDAGLLTPRAGASPAGVR